MYKTPLNIPEYYGTTSALQPVHYNWEPQGNITCTKHRAIFQDILVQPLHYNNNIRKFWSTVLWRNLSEKNATIFFFEDVDPSGGIWKILKTLTLLKKSFKIISGKMSREKCGNSRQFKPTAAPHLL